MTNRAAFDVLAELIQEYVPNVRKGEAATKIATLMEQECPRFNRERFLTMATQQTLV